MMKHILQNEDKLKEIPIDKIQVIENVRTSDESLHELMHSLKHEGLHQPIKVYRTNGEYILIMGFRRFMSAKKLGWKTIPAIVTQKLSEKDHLVANIVENIQRKNISPIELGRLCVKLREMNLNQSEIATRLSVTNSKVRGAMDAYKHLPEKYRDEVEFQNNKTKTGKISFSVANQIVNESTRGNIPKIQAEKLFDLAKSKELTIQQMRMVISLVKTGMLVEKAHKKMNEHGVVRLEIIYKNNEMIAAQRKYGLSRGNIVRAVLNGTIPTDKIKLL